MSTGTPATQPNPPPNRDSTQEAFEFVRALATELTNGTISIPSFPEVALRLQRLLADENADAERVVRLLGAEPALAARILSMANSAALNPGGQRVADLRVAVTRMGFDMLRSAAISFAMAQVKAAEQYRAIEKPMNRLWRRSVEVASLCRVIARRHRALIADAALRALRRWEPRVSVEAVRAVADPERLSQVNLEVRYRLLADERRETLQLALDLG